MLSSQQDYELLDFGNGRRVERFGALTLDRPCPVAEGSSFERPDVRRQADVVFLAEKNSRFDPDSERGVWKPLTEKGRAFFPTNDFKPWPVSFKPAPIKLELRGTPFGHLGVFPEQQSNWLNIFETISKAAASRTGLIRVLNLFAYTGGSSLAAASASPGMEVVHVDAAKPVVDWARRNAELSGLQHVKIRFLVEDARKFVQRERKRGNRYDAVILDPPSYGHGVKGETWKIADDLPELLHDISALWTDDPLFCLLTAHTPLFDAKRLRDAFRDQDSSDRFRIKSFEMEIPTTTGRRLPAGCGIFCLR